MQQESVDPRVHDDHHPPAGGELPLRRKWTGASAEQKGDYQQLPPALVLNTDETVLDNLQYQVWMMKNDQTFSTKTWNQFCATQISKAIPGAVEFAKQAADKDFNVGRGSGGLAA